MVKDKRHYIVEGIAAVMIISCLVSVVRMNLLNRTLWLDEAMLAFSFNTRSFLELFQPPLSYNQSAPFG